MIEGIWLWRRASNDDCGKNSAGNEGTMGNVGGAVGGFMMGGAMGGSIVDIARNALYPERFTQSKRCCGTKSHVGNGPKVWMFRISLN